ncbi:MAG TPA: hypothetical protein VF615_25725 [Longimicrobiaceae bacterium]
MSPPEGLREELPVLGRRYGWPTLMAEMCSLVTEFAVKGMEAAVTAERGDPKQDCARCRRNDALLRQTEAVLRRTKTQPATAGADPEKRDADDR